MVALILLLDVIIKNGFKKINFINMAYNAELKADDIIFEKMMFIKVRDSHVLKPIMADKFDAEVKMFFKNSNTEGVKKYLNSIYVSSEEEAREKLNNFMLKTIYKASLFYCIRPVELQAPIGYIHMNSPITESGLNSWSVDFWISDMFAGQNIMTLSLAYMLEYLQNNLVPEVVALVDEDNLASIRVLQKIGFKLDHKEMGGEERLYFVIKLN